MKKVLTLSAIVFAMITTAAQAEVSISSVSYQKNSEDKWVKATKVIPGTIVRYYNKIENTGDKDAEELSVVNPVPEYMAYIADTALCQDECTIRFSVDGGETYDEPDNLKVEEDGKERKAKASEYTHIRWVIDALAADTTTVVEYRAQLK